MSQTPGQLELHHLPSRFLPRALGLGLMLLAAVSMPMHKVSASGQSAADPKPERQETQAPQTAHAADNAQSAAKPIDPNQTAVQRIWWNRSKKIEALGLTESQRLQMDALLEEFLAQRGNHSQGHKAAMAAFAAMALSDNVEALEAQVEATSLAVAANKNHQIRMMAAVAQLLTSRQKASIQEKFPQLFRQTWVRTYRPRAGGQGKAVRKRNRAGQKNQ